MHRLGDEPALVDSTKFSDADHHSAGLLINLALGPVI